MQARVTCILMLCSLSTCCWLSRNWRAWAANQNNNTVTLWFRLVSRTKLAWLCKPFHPGMTGNYHRCWYSGQWMILEIEYPVTCKHLSAPIQVWSNKCWASDRWISCCYIVCFSFKQFCPIHLKLYALPLLLILLRLIQTCWQFHVTTSLSGNHLQLNVVNNSIMWPALTGG